MLLHMVEILFKYLCPTLYSPSHSSFPRGKYNHDVTVSMTCFEPVALAKWVRVADAVFHGADVLLPISLQEDRECFPRLIVPSLPLCCSEFIKNQLSCQGCLCRRWRCDCWCGCWSRMIEADVVTVVSATSRCSRFPCSKAALALLIMTGLDTCGRLLV